MNFGQLQTMARAQVPGAKISRVSPDVLELILNNGKDDVAIKTKCLKANQKFNLSAVSSGIAEYNLSTTINRFLVIDKPGLWYLDGSVYRKLDPTTIEWLDENRTYWRNEGPGSPRLYYQNGNTLGIVPAPSAAVTNGGWLYFGQRPQNMTSGTDYPFGGSYEIERLIPLQHAIIAYARWQIGYILNEGLDNYRMGEDAYKRELAERQAEVDRRPDISSVKTTKYQGPIVC